MDSSDPYTGSWPAVKVRQEFFNFFQSKGHTFVPSSPTIPYEDPTRLFANAGMNQFKPIFLHTVDPRSDMAKLKRAYNNQKCIRAGDLEVVGKDAYHHTFFEMLGSWSFGDYFKRDAISSSWQLLTEVYKLPKDRLYVTYFEGDPKNGLAPDEETRQLWLDLGVTQDHILTGNRQDNFWEMGPKGAAGPCGPCTEIHFDRIGSRNAGHLVNQGTADVIELWNNVFIQFNREDDGSFRALPVTYVDTGMGLERLVSAVQGRRSNYDTDLFTPIFRMVQETFGIRPYEGKFGAEDSDGIDTAYRVVADHARTMAFSLCDGGVLDEVGRGYMLRRIFRRGFWYAKKNFNVPIGHLFSSILPAIAEQMGIVFPELTKKLDYIKEVMNKEEDSFSRSLDLGERRLQQYAAKAKQLGATVLSDEDVRDLYDNYGIPADLVRLMAEEQSLGVNEQEYEIAQAAKFLQGW